MDELLSEQTLLGCGEEGSVKIQLGDPDKSPGSFCFRKTYRLLNIRHDNVEAKLTIQPELCLLCNELFLLACYMRLFWLAYDKMHRANPEKPMNPGCRLRGLGEREPLNLVLTKWDFVLVFFGKSALPPRNKSRLSFIHLYLLYECSYPVFSWLG